MEKFEVGDKVEVVKRYNVYKVGKVGTITSIRELNDDTIYYRINDDRCGAPSYYFKKVEDSLYEDQWHLNDGKVEIPDDADKLEKDGSVVAFRKRKVKDLEFGDELFGCVTGTRYRFIRYSNYLKTHCDALNSENMIATNQKLGEQLIRK